MPENAFLPWTNPAQARGVLAVALGAALLFVAVTLSPLKSGFADAPDRGPGDIALYRAEVDRIHAGEGYYEAAAAELRSRGYPTRSVFNWRTPLPIAPIGWLPEPDAAKFLLGALGLVVLLCGFGLVADECGMRSAAVATLCLTGAVLPCVLGNLFVASELWAGMLIAISIVALGRGKTKAGVFAGVAALFLRELTGLYFVIAAGIALVNRRWKEVWLWGAGLAAYAIYFGVHAWQVKQLIGPDDIAHAASWVRFGGAGFVISTVQMNAYLLLLPQWLSAVYLALSLLGFAAWNTSAGQRAGITAAAYLAAFAVVGQPFNQYWGSMFAPLLCLGAGHGAVTLARLWKAARWPATSRSVADPVASRGAALH